jgi:hypothetical protein
VTTLYDQEQAYREAMREAFAEIRDYAFNAPTDFPPELARAVWLAIPAVRFGLDVRDRELNLALGLWLLAAHEYGGEHGYSASRIEEEADHLVGLYFIEQDAKSATGRV